MSLKIERNLDKSVNYYTFDDFKRNMTVKRKKERKKERKKGERRKEKN